MSLNVSSLPRWKNEMMAEAIRNVKARAGPEWTPHLPTPHPKQVEFIESPAKRKVIRAGRRSGKTFGIAIQALQKFLEGRRVLYAAPTEEQVDAFWFEVKDALAEGIDCGALYKNETEHVIERTGTKNRIRAKTAWNPDTLRGDYADYLILDEYHLMADNTFDQVGAPMLLDNNGDAVFIYTPPSVRTVNTSKARDKMHAAKLFKRAQADTSGRWATFHFSSHDNPHLNREALAEITQDMTARSYQQEIMAVDLEDTPGALWNREMLDKLRVSQMPQLTRIAVAIDPSITATGDSDEAGIIAAGVGPCNCTGKIEQHGFVLEDASLHGSPSQWAMASVALYNKLGADILVAEVNQGGAMVSLTIGTIKGAPTVKLIHASKNKVARAEPVAALYAPVDTEGKPLPGRVHHVGYFAQLEDEQCNYVAGAKSPNRLDGLVYALTELMLGGFDVDEWIDHYKKQSENTQGGTPQMDAPLPALPAGVQSVPQYRPPVPPRW